MHPRKGILLATFSHFGHMTLKGKIASKWVESKGVRKTGAGVVVFLQADVPWGHGNTTTPPPNFAVDFWLDVFLLFWNFPRETSAKKSPSKFTQKSVQKMSLGFLQKPFLEILVVTCQCRECWDPLPPHTEDEEEHEQQEDDEVDDKDCAVLSQKIRNPSAPNPPPPKKETLSWGTKSSYQDWLEGFLLIFSPPPGPCDFPPWSSFPCFFGFPCFFRRKEFPCFFELFSLLSQGF